MPVTFDYSRLTPAELGGVDYVYNLAKSKGEIPGEWTRDDYLNDRKPGQPTIDDWMRQADEADAATFAPLYDLSRKLSRASRVQVAQLIVARAQQEKLDLSGVTDLINSLSV